MRALLVVAVALGACNGSSSSSEKGLVTKIDQAEKVEKTAPVPRGAPVKRGTVKREAFAIYGVIPQTCTAEKAEAKLRAALGKADVKIDRVGIGELGWDVGGSHELIALAAEPSDAALIDKVKTGVMVGANNAPAMTGKLASAALAAATDCNGWVVAMMNGHVFDVAQGKEHLPLGAPDARKLVALHGMSGDNEIGFIDTMGMEQMGLPDLTLRNVPTGHMDHAANLVNAAAQALIQEGDVTRDGELDVDASKLTGDWHAEDLKATHGTGKLTWTVRWQDHDPDGTKLDRPLLELLPPGSDGKTAVALMAAVDTYFGAIEDHGQVLTGMQDELAAAGVLARAGLKKQLPHFVKGIAPHESLSVKAPFNTDDGNIEWMWVDVFKINATDIEGTLDNSPDRVSSLKIGAHVKVKFDKIADYIFHRDGEKTEGGYSYDVARKHGIDVPPLD